MRTDSTRISDDAITAVRSHIQSTHGDKYLPEKPNRFASGKAAQEAHEAVRPTDVTLTPHKAHSLGLHGDQLRLYSLIYHRFVACQMSPAVFAVTNVEVKAQTEKAIGLFKAQGKILKFDGYRKEYHSHKQEDANLPHMDKGQALDRI